METSSGKGMNRETYHLFIDFPLPCLITKWCVTIFDFCNSSPKALGFRL